MEQPTWIVALAAGVLSFFSPCVFPLVPAYVSQLTGSLVQNRRMETDRKLLLIRSVSFMLGFGLVFVAMGASASWIGQFLAGHRPVIEKISGLVILVFGLQMAGLLALRPLMAEKRWIRAPSSGKGQAGAFLLGLAFASGWTPCVGLALSSILLLAGSAETLHSGIFLLAVYALGLGLPFLIVSVMLTYSLGIMKKISRFLPLLSKINGWILVGVGLLLFTGQLQKLSAWFGAFGLVPDF